MAGNQTKIQHTMLIQKVVETPHFMKTAKGGKRIAGVVSMAQWTRRIMCTYPNKWQRSFHCPYSMFVMVRQKVGEGLVFIWAHQPYCTVAPNYAVPPSKMGRTALKIVTARSV